MILTGDFGLPACREGAEQELCGGNEIAEINLPLQDLCHTYKPGHRIMIQIQSSWFPLIDRNPQKYVENIFKATADDFIKATHRVYHNPEASSWIEFKIAK